MALMTTLSRALLRSPVTASSRTPIPSYPSLPPLARVAPAAAAVVIAGSAMGCISGDVSFPLFQAFLPAEGAHHLDYEGEHEGGWVEYQLILSEHEGFELSDNAEERILAVSEGPILARSPAFLEQGSEAIEELNGELQELLLVEGDLCDRCHIELNVLWIEPPPDTTPDAEGLVGILRVDEVQVDDGALDAFAQAWAWGILDQPFPDGFYGEYSANYTGQLWTAVAAEGPCQVVASTMGGSCDPACGEDEICSFDDRCEPRPQWAPAGDIALAGLSESVVLTPAGTGAYQTVMLPPGSLESGVTVTASAVGDQTPAFTLAAAAPQPLEPALPCEQGIEQGFTLSWTPGGGDALIRLQVDSALHAANGPALICETEDDGSLEVPASVLEAYLPYHGELSLWQLMRLERTEVQLDDGQRVQLELRSVRACLGG